MDLRMRGRGCRRVGGSGIVLLEGQWGICMRGWSYDMDSSSTLPRSFLELFRRYIYILRLPSVSTLPAVVRPAWFKIASPRTSHSAETQNIDIVPRKKVGSKSEREKDKMADPLPTIFAERLAESKAKYVNLGKSGLRVSVPILGAMSIGSKEWAPWVIEEEEVSWDFLLLLAIAISWRT
jgi:hypothetical protein